MARKAQSTLNNSPIQKKWDSISLNRRSKKPLEPLCPLLISDNGRNSDPTHPHRLPHHPLPRRDPIQQGSRSRYDSENRKEVAYDDGDKNKQRYKRNRVCTSEQERNTLKNKKTASLKNQYKRPRNDIQHQKPKTCIPSDTIGNSRSVIQFKDNETDERRLEQRQKQIDYGKNTTGYDRYISLVPRGKRKPSDPQTPDKYELRSKRSWDGVIRKWRQLLHGFDPVHQGSSNICVLDSSNNLSQVKRGEESLCSVSSTMSTTSTATATTSSTIETKNTDISEKNLSTSLFSESLLEPSIYDEFHEDEDDIL